MLNHFYRSSAEKELGKIIKERHSAVSVYGSPPGKGVGWGGRAMWLGKHFVFFILCIIKLLAGHRALNFAPPS